MTCDHTGGQVGPPDEPDACACRPTRPDRWQVLEHRLRDLVNPWDTEPPADLIPLSAAIKVIRETLATEPVVTYRAQWETR